MPLPIAVDAMGGDHAPTEIVRGALRAFNEHGIAVTLVGRREVVEAELRAAGPTTPDAITVVDAREVIEMNEHPANAVRAKRDSSLVSSCALVAGGQAGAVVSAGNSGAMLAAALLHHQTYCGHCASGDRSIVPERVRPDVHPGCWCQHRL